MWKVVPLAEDGAKAWRTTVTGESDVKIVTGAKLSITVRGGPVDVLGALADSDPFYPLNDLQGASLTTKRDCLEGIAERVYAVKVRGTGTVTLFAVRRG